MDRSQYRWLGVRVFKNLPWTGSLLASIGRLSSESPDCLSSLIWSRGNLPFAIRTPTLYDLGLCSICNLPMRHFDSTVLHKFSCIRNYLIITLWLSCLIVPRSTIIPWHYFSLLLSFPPNGWVALSPLARRCINWWCQCQGKHVSWGWILRTWGSLAVLIMKGNATKIQFIDFIVELLYWLHTLPVQVRQKIGFGRQGRERKSQGKSYHLLGLGFTLGKPPPANLS